MRTPLQTIQFKNRPAIMSAAATVGPKEGKGPLAGCFDDILPDDLLGCDTWEQAESEMMRRTIMRCIEKAGLCPEQVEIMMAGDLLNQIAASGFCARAMGRPFVGLYGACSTMIEALLLGAALVDGGYRENAVCSASSHFCTAERQFRFPVELGNQRPPSAQWTATAAGAVLISARPAGAMARITCGTFGVVTDYKIKDANHMGAAMAPAVAGTLCAHLTDTRRTAEDYDLVVTGDLGLIGRKILLELLRERGVRVREEALFDCGANLYSPEQDAHAGGSGCGCIASVLCGKFLPDLKRGAIKRALVLGSGAMLSPTTTMQGESIPSISYAVALEGAEEE